MGESSFLGGDKEGGAESAGDGLGEPDVRGPTPSIRTNSGRHKIETRQRMANVAWIAT